MSARASALLLVGLIGAAALDLRAAGNEEAAARQYRVARRLAADGSPEATAALREVIRLDPEGALVDDALVDLALLVGLPAVPEEIGRLEVLEARGALQYLDRVVGELPLANRADEARYLRALVRLEPLPGHDLASSRLDLTAVATADPPTSWSAPARYALGWLHEQQGRWASAEAAYQRILIDTPFSPVTSRAHAGVARLLMRRGEAGRAARMLQQAIDAGEPSGNDATRLREAAVREVLRGLGPAGESVFASASAGKIPTGRRSVRRIASTQAGGLLVGDRRAREVVELDERGDAVGRWPLQDLQAVAVDSRGRRFAAADEFIYRLAEGGHMVRVASLGSFAPVSGLAVDGLGGFWVLDRRGQRLGRVRPGAAGTAPYWEERTYRLQDLAWDGSRLVSIDAKTNAVIAFAADGTPRPVFRLEGGRLDSIDTDPLGRIAVLDPRDATVLLLNPDGKLALSIALEPLGVRAPTAIAAGRDGTLHLFDDADGSWVRVP